MDKRLYIAFALFRVVNACLCLYRAVRSAYWTNSYIIVFAPVTVDLSTLSCIFVRERRSLLTLPTAMFCRCFCQYSQYRDLAKSFFCGDKRCAYIAAKYSLFCPCRSLRHNLLMKHSAGCASPLRYFVIRDWKQKGYAAFGEKEAAVVATFFLLRFYTVNACGLPR